jgi:hypothetical protein
VSYVDVARKSWHGKVVADRYVEILICGRDVERGSVQRNVEPVLARERNAGQKNCGYQAHDENYRKFLRWDYQIFGKHLKSYRLSCI